MKTYGLNDRLPDLPTDPPEPDFECNACGELFNASIWEKQAKFIECPNCYSRDIHRT